MTAAGADGDGVERNRAPWPPIAARPTARRIVALAASTGGPKALATVLKGIRGLDAAVVLVQHIGHQSIGGLASWLARSTGWPIDIADDGDVLVPGRVAMGPAGSHITISEGGRILLAKEPESSHRPSADELFLSLARSMPRATVAAILTGMGDDGARGLEELNRAGGYTIAQDEASSAVFGMAKAAIDRGAIRQIVALDEVAPAIVRISRGPW